MRSVCLVSGGLDSYLAWWTTQATPVFVKYGQTYVEEELIAATALYKDLQIVSIDGLPNQSQRYIPCRNLIFCALATHWDCDTIYVAGMDDDIDLDKSPEEFVRMSQILSRYANRKIEITSPWWGYSKASAVAKYLEAGGPQKQLQQTFSCYASEKCGECDACYRWSVALLSNKVDASHPSINCLIDHGVRQLWHRPVERLHELCRAMDFIGVEYREFYVKDSEMLDDVNEAFLDGAVVILMVPCAAQDCTLFADKLRNMGYLFHGVVSDNSESAAGSNR